MSDNQAEFKKLVIDVWSSNNKNVLLNQSLAQALAAKKIQADFTYAKPQNDTEILPVHRTLPDREIYWLNNRKDRIEAIEASFRIIGKAPEIWHPENGKIEKVSFQIKDGRTSIPLWLEPNDAVFVVFKR